MSTSIEFTDEGVAELKDLTGEADTHKAIRVAVSEYIKYALRMRLISLSGQVAMEDNWRELEADELR